MKRNRIVFLVLFLLAAAVAVLVRRDAAPTWRVPGPDCRIVIPVFALHRVLPDQASEYILSPERIDALLDELNRRGFTPISLSDLESALTANGPLPARPAMITFDDTYLDNFTYAVPRLQDQGWPAVFFVPTGKITDPSAERIAWGDGPEPYAMQWPEVLALRDGGMEIGSHSVNHVNLARAVVDSVRAELTQSRQTLAERLGSAPRALAYPGGRQNSSVRAAAQEAGYSLAFLSGGGPIQLATAPDPLALPRVHVAGYIDPRAVVRAIPENHWQP